jgi:hypothetical protein
MRQPSRMVVDITSFISAEEFILSQNRGEVALDPFARQCYAEVVHAYQKFVYREFLGAWKKM